jgi:2,3-bisphosphoglycerate-independent phosphoglycerate mutase
MTLSGEMDVATTPPHDILGQPADKHLPTGNGSDRLRGLIERSQAILGEHEINTVRRDLGENPATSVWLWGQGKMPTLPNFADKYGLSAAVITAVDLVRGIAVLAGMDRIEVEGATGYIDTNYAGKGAAAVAALDKYDLVIVHVEATDECGHNAEVAEKTKAIGQIDEHIVKPILERLQAEGDQWRILITPDHPTPCAKRTHTANPVPFLIAGKGVKAVLCEPFTEEAAEASDLHIDFGHELMEYFLKTNAQ